MTGFRALSSAMLKGFYRDRMTIFFTVFFPLFFILIFGVVFSGGNTQSRQKLIPVGDVAFVQSLAQPARAAFDEVFDLQPPESLDAALDAVRTGDAAAALEQQGDALVVHISRADRQIVQRMTRNNDRLVAENAKLRIDRQIFGPDVL